MNPDNQLTAVLAHLIKQMGDAAQHYGPQAIELAGQYLQTEAILNLIADGIMYAVVAVAFVILWKVVTPARKEHGKDILDQNIDLMIGGTIMGVAASIALLAIIIGVTIDFLTPSIWIAAFSTKLALVHQAMQAVSK